MPRTLTHQEAAGLARFFQQTHDAFVFLTAATQPANANTTVTALMAQLNVTGTIAGSIQAFMQASFVYTWDVIFKAGYGNANMLAWVDLTKFTIRLNSPAKKSGMSQVDKNRVESDEEKVLRHLRNCFAHYRYGLQLQQNNRIAVQLDDFDTKGSRTFDATCDFNDLIDLAERLLIQAHSEAGLVANPLAPASLPPAQAQATHAAPTVPSAPPHGGAPPTP